MIFSDWTDSGPFWYIILDTLCGNKMQRYSWHVGRFLVDLGPMWKLANEGGAAGTSFETNWAAEIALVLEFGLQRENAIKYLRI